VAAPGEATEEPEDDPELELKLEPDSDPLSSMLLSEEEDSSAPISRRRVGMGACICAAVKPTQISRIAAAKSLQFIFGLLCAT